MEVFTKYSENSDKKKSICLEKSGQQQDEVATTK